ncbi:unnamed protein product [Staurois parvus]|uniref:Uncharacterized protein n=1 Tax=Staurois parvus TaxID=386267 RepID=A0ABN9CJR0_9NEOB|nr:unnamed protein product [Staurois parvus]
MITTKRSL